MSLYSALVASSTTVPLNGHENVSGGARGFLVLFTVGVAFLLFAGWFRRPQ